MTPGRRRKSVLYLSVHDPRVPLNGSGTRAGAFVSRLAGRFDVDLLFLEGSGQPPIPRLAERFASRVAGVRSAERVRFRPTDYFLFSRAAHRSARRLLEERRHDFLLCDYGLSAIYGLLLKGEFDVPFIYSSHNIEYLGYLDKARKDPRRLLLLPYVYAVEKAAARRSDLLVAITEQDADRYARWVGREKILVVPQGFDPSVFNPFYRMTEDGRRIVLFCGNFGIGFNRDAMRVTLRRILDPVLSECPDTLFRFVGARPPKHPPHPNVEFTGFIEEYPACLREAHVVISPMKNGRGSPTKVIEALACGKSVVSTPVGARSLERDYRSLHVREIDAFPETICRILKNGPYVTADDFERITARHSWEKNIPRLVEWMDAYERDPLGSSRSGGIA